MNLTRVREGGNLLFSLLAFYCQEKYALALLYTNENQTRNKEIEAIQGLGGQMTRARAKKAKEALNQMMATFIELDS